MALRTPLTAQPHLYIGDSTGRPLDYGRVYFGEQDKDPEFYPIDIYLDPEMTIAAAQPVRTKGGFMDVGGNLAELHAAEVIYSLKVLDQYGRQVFYKPEMYRNNVSDFLVDEITRATAAETLIAGNLTTETQRAVAAEKVIADAVVTEKDRAVAAEVALDIKHAALSSTINSLGGGKKAYTTYALMVADKNNIAANSSIDVTNDTDPLKNGTYSYDGAVFAKSIYDVEAIVRTKVLNTFKTKALMDASALPDGADAQVTDDTVNNGLYVKTAEAWVRPSYDPVRESNNYTDDKIDSKIYGIDSEDVFVFTDEDGNIGVSIDKVANLNANNINSKQLIAGIAWAVIDENGNIAIAVDDEGNFISSVTDKLKEDVEALQAGGIDTPQANIAASQPKTDLMHIFSYGQSLSRGVRAIPVISTTQPYSNLTFASGVIPKVDVAHDYTSFKPLIEQIFGSEGETPTSGMLNNFVGFQVAKGDTAEKWQMVGTAPGQEGRTIAQLSKGTANYSGMLTQAQAAYDIAQAQGKTYSVWSMTWTQGENDYAGVGTTQAAYLTALLKLRDDFNADVKAITNQPFNPITVMYQTAGHRHTNYQKDTMQIALAQLQAATENDDMVMACPIYNLPHYTDNLHLTADSSYQLGRYYAKALEYTLFSGEKWQPLQPKNVFKQGKVIDIEFNKSGLVIDTTLVAATHNMGFDMWSGDTLLDIITSVTVTDSNRVRLVLSATPPAGTILSYARGRTGDPAAAGPITGARGNLRDNAGDTDKYTDSKGATRYMHNWCAMFEKTI